MAYLKGVSFLALLSILVACDNNKKETFLAYTHDGEIAHGWINQSTLQEVPDAYSGKFVSVIDQTNPYGLGYREKISEIKAPFNTIDISCMIRGTADGENVAGIMLGMDLAGEPKFLEGKDFSKEILKGKWTNITARFKVPYETPKDYVISAYVMNKKGGAMHIDDFKIKFFIE